jgi:hypothetical protein
MMFSSSLPVTKELLVCLMIATQTTIQKIQEPEEVWIWSGFGLLCVYLWVQVVASEWTRWRKLPQQAMATTSLLGVKKEGNYEVYFFLHKGEVAVLAAGSKAYSSYGELEAVEGCPVGSKVIRIPIAEENVGGGELLKEQSYRQEDVYVTHYDPVWIKKRILQIAAEQQTSVEWNPELGARAYAGNGITLGSFPYPDMELIAFFHELGHKRPMPRRYCFCRMADEGVAWEWGLNIAYSYGYQWSCYSLAATWGIEQLRSYVGGEENW